MAPMDMYGRVRRRRHHHPRRVRPLPEELDRDARFVVVTVLGWMERVLQASQHISQPAAELLAWALRRKLDPLVRPVLCRWFEEDDDRAEAFARAREPHLVAPPSRRAQALVWLARQEDEAPRRLIADVVRASKERAAELSYRGKAPLERNLRKVRKLFGLDLDQERLLLIYIASVFPNVEQWLLSCGGHGSGALHRTLSLALRCRPSAPARALDDTFHHMGLLEEERSCLRMDPAFWPMLEESPDALMRRGLYAEAATDAPPLADFSVPDSSVAFMVDLLRRRPIGGSRHVLVYGDPGVGKTSLVRAVAREAGARAYEIAVPDDGRTRTRWAAMQACLNMTNNGEGSLIIVDDADRLLGSERGWMMDGEVQDRSRINQLMDRDRTRFVWVVNDVRHIAPSVRRRFAYCLHVPQPGRRQRQRQWEAVARNNGVTSLLGPEQAKALSRRYSVTATGPWPGRPNRWITPGDSSTGPSCAWWRSRKTAAAGGRSSTATRSSLKRPAMVPVTWSGTPWSAWSTPGPSGRSCSSASTRSGATWPCWSASRASIPARWRWRVPTSPGSWTRPPRTTRPAARRRRSSSGSWPGRCAAWRWTPSRAWRRGSRGLGPARLAGCRRRAA